MAKLRRNAPLILGFVVLLVALAVLFAIPIEGQP